MKKPMLVMMLSMGSLCWAQAPVANFRNCCKHGQRPGHVSCATEKRGHGDG
jgi:hypothetical protein